MLLYSLHHRNFNVLFSQCSLIEEPNDAVRIMLTRLQHSDLLIGDIVLKLNPGPSTNQAVNNVRSRRTPNVAFCLLNARSLKNKTAAFVDYVQDCKADIFVITETWLTQNDAVICTEITPAGYRLLHRPRADRVGGGTALLFKDSFNVRQLAAGEKSSFEFSEYPIKALSF